MSCRAKFVGIPSLNFHEPLAPHASGILQVDRSFPNFPFPFPRNLEVPLVFFQQPTLGFRAKTRLLALFTP